MLTIDLNDAIHDYILDNVNMTWHEIKLAIHEAIETDGTALYDMLHAEDWECTCGLEIKLIDPLNPKSALCEECQSTKTETGVTA